MFTHTTSEPVLTLVDANGDIFIGHISFPTKDSTIREYEAWERQYTYNMISLSSRYTPQIICHSSIKEIRIFEPKISLCSEVDFRHLLSKLFALKTREFYLYEDTIDDYFKSFEEPCTPEKT